VSAVAAEVLAAGVSEARISSIALEALVSVAVVPDVTDSPNVIIMILGG